MHRFNTKLVVGLLLLVGVVSVGVTFLHAAMVKSNAGGLLKLADKAKDEGNLAEAMREYKRYKQYRPNDPEVYVKLAKAAVERCKNVNNQRLLTDSYKYLNDAARMAPDDSDVRRDLISVSITLRQWSSAIEEIKRMMQRAPDDAELDLQLARCYSQTSRTDEAIEICNRLIGYQTASDKFVAAKARDAHLVDAYLLLADILRRRNRLADPRLASRVMDQMVAANPDSATAHLLHGRYLQQQAYSDRNQQRSGEVEKIAKQEFESALKISPNDGNAIIEVGNAALAARDYAEAKKQFDRGVELYPQNERMYVGQYKAARQMHQLDVAEAALREGLKHEPDSAEILMQLIDLQLMQRDVDGARATQAELTKLNLVDFELQIAQARLLMVGGEWLAASKLLEDARLSLAQSPEPLERVLLLLSDCYERLGQPDRQMEVANLLVSLNPRSINTQVAMASALLAQGKVLEALGAYESVEKSLPSGASLEEIPILWERLFRLRIAQQLSLPRLRQDWKKLDEMVARMKDKSALEPADWAAAAADLASVEGDGDRAREILRDALKSSPNNPKNVALWISLSNVVWRQTNDEQRTLQSLDEAEQQLPGNVQLRMQRLNLVARSGGSESRAAVAALARDTPKFSEDDQLRWLESLGYAQRRVGDARAARETWRQLTQLRKDDLVAYLMIFDLSLELNDDPAMQQALTEIRKLSGDDALYKVVAAKRILALIQNRALKEPNPALRGLTAAEFDNLAVARRLLTEAKEKRPNWYEISHTLAKVELLDNHPAAAIENLRQALTLGIRSPDVTRQLVQLLASQGQDAEALRYLGTLPSDHGGERDREEASLLARTGQLDRALELANQLVPETSTAANDLLWQGNLLARANKRDEAEAVLRRAVKAAPDRPESWLSLVRFLIDGKRTLDAQQALTDAKLELPADLVAPALAEGYQMAGNLPAAEQNYLDYLADRPDDFAAKRALAAFYLQFRREDPTYAGKAATQLKGILKSTEPEARESVAWARRESAMLHGPTADYAEHLADVALVRQNAVGGALSVIDQSLIADLQADRGDAASRRAAIRGYEALQAQRSLSASQALRLAQLYDQTGRWDEARQTIQSLLGQGAAEPRTIAIYCDMLLRHGDLGLARVYVDRLRTLDSNGARSLASVSLQARLLAATGKGDEAAALLDAQIIRPVPAEKREELRTIALVLEQMKLYPQAEGLLREYAANNPPAMPLLAGFLAQHGKLAEAMELCAAGQKEAVNPGLIQACIEGLRVDSNRASKSEQFSRIEKWLDDGLQQDPKSLILTSQLADLRQLQGRFDECEKLYRRCLGELAASNQDKWKTWNNLAYLLATTGKGVAEAVRLSNQAVQAVGPAISLLDTRAMVYLAAGDTTRAFDDMKLVIEDDPRSPLNYVHLAAIQQALGQNEAAQGSLKTAQEKGLVPPALNPLERSRYDRLVAALKK